MGPQASCVPCASDARSREDGDDPAQSRQYLRDMLRQSPAWVPHEMEQGFPFHDCDVSLTHDVSV